MGLNSQDKTNAADQAEMVIANGDVPSIGETNAKVSQKSDGSYALHVITELSSITPGVQPVTPPETEWEDMNGTTGGIARGTSLGPADGKTRIYSYTGSGVLYGWLTTVSNLSSDWRVYMEIDGNDNFGTSGLLMDDFKGVNAYNYSPSVQEFHMGLATAGDTLRFKGVLEFPIRFLTSFEIFVERISNPSKTWDAGLVCIKKD